MTQEPGSRTHEGQRAGALTAKQKNPQPGQQWCWTMCERWTSHSTRRGTRLEGRMVSPLIVRLVQALSWRNRK